MEPFQPIPHLQALSCCLIEPGRSVNAFQEIISHEDGKICLDDGKAGIGSIDYSGNVLTILAHVQDLHYYLISASSLSHIKTSQKASIALYFDSVHHMHTFCIAFLNSIQLQILIIIVFNRYRYGPSAT